MFNFKSGIPYRSPEIQWVISIFQCCFFDIRTFFVCVFSRQLIFLILLIMYD